MRYRELGNTGIKVSEISFGTIPILQGSVPVLPEYFNLSDNEAVQVLQYAYSLGCTLFDTAIVPEYGDAELKLGKFLKLVDRSSVVVSNKARFFTGNEMYEAVEKSFENLGSYSDIYFVHQVDLSNEDMTFRKNGAIDALVDQKKEGKVNFVGVASHYYSILNRAANDPRVDVLQGSGNILERGMLERMEESNNFAKKGFILNKVYAAGILPKFFSVEEMISGALSYNVSSALLGLGTHEQVDMAMKSEFKPHLLDFGKVISRLEKIFKPISCDRCQRCHCSKGIEIHILFRQYNYYFLGKDYWSLRKLDLEIREQVKKCNSCTDQICITDCPRNIYIPYEFEKIKKLVDAHIRKGII